MRYTAVVLLSTTILDLHWTGRPRSIAAALLRSGAHNALIDPGPASTISTLREQLSRQGVSFRDLHCVFLTHIHLDHAGATGSMLKENPDLQIFVHSQGASHLGDPSKLLSSASRLYGEKMLPLFGEFLPVPSENLRVLYGGETLPFGDNYLRVLYTPGHASHHVTYFDRSEGIAFVGDTAGICIEGHPFALPAAPPPDINVETWIQSLEVIAQLNPRRLFLTHFGFSDNPSRHLASYRNRLQHWSDIASRILASGAEDSAAMQEFIRQISDEAAPLLNADESRHYLYNGNVPLSWLGLARYHRKRSAAPA